MKSFSLHKGKSQELSPFPYMVEFSRKKNQSVQPNSFEISENQFLRFIFIIEGKFHWMIDNQPFVVFPNDCVVVSPQQTFGSENGSFEVGTFYSITIQISSFENGSTWSNISEAEFRLIGKLISLNKKPVLQNFKLAGEIVQKIDVEISTNELGYKTRVNHLIDELLISTARQLSKQENQRRDFPQTFRKLDQILRENLSHPWTVEEMAVIMGLGTTAFTEKVKSFSGFSPLNYLINLRISEAIRLLKSTNLSLTDIALDTGFYSSQHFSTTFKKLTGYTPGHFRKTPNP